MIEKCKIIAIKPFLNKEKDLIIKIAISVYRNCSLSIHYRTAKALFMNYMLFLMVMEELSARSF
jgi:hypothetical protein